MDLLDMEKVQDMLLSEKSKFYNTRSSSIPSFNHSTNISSSHHHCCRVCEFSTEQSRHIPALMGLVFSSESESHSVVSDSL